MFPKAEKHRSLLGTLSQNPNAEPKASLLRSHHPQAPACVAGGSRAHRGWGQHVLPCCPAMLPGFLLTGSPSASTQGRAGGSSEISVYLQITLPPPFENSLLYAYFCIASYLPGRASALFAVRNPMYNQTFNGFFCCCFFILFLIEGKAPIGTTTAV